MAAEPHPCFREPVDRSIKVWRYMDLPKFLYILQNRALYFARADILGDPYEGYYTKASVSVGEELFVQSVRANNASTGGVLPDEAGLRSAFRMGLANSINMREHFFVSSWHMNRVESAAMWRLYTSLNESICVSCSYDSFSRSLPPQVHLGEVDYIDFDADIGKSGNIFWNILHKRASYAHENEVRGVIWQMEEIAQNKFIVEGKGLKVPVDLNLLIEEVYLTPSASEMLKPIIENLLRTYSRIVPVIQSGVNSPPDYLI